MSSASIDINIEGFAELRKKIIKLGDDKDKIREVRAILMALSKPTLDLARRLAPVGSKFIEINNKKYQRKNYNPGIGKESLARKVMTRSRLPMVTISPRSRKSADGYYLRQFVIPGHNIYRTGFKRSKIGNRSGRLAEARQYNSRGAKSRTDKNYFLDRAYDATKGRVTKDAEEKMSKFIQRRINRLSKA